MDIFNFSKKMLLRNFNKCINYSLVVYITLIISFVFGDFNKNLLLLENDQVIGGATFIEMTIPLSVALPFIVIVLCWMMLLYASNFYINNQTDSFAIILLSGGSAIDVAKFVLWQVAIIFLGNLIIALLTAPLILKLIYRFMFSYLRIDAVYHIPLDTYLFVLYSLIPILMIVCISIAGFSHRNTLQILLGRTKTNKIVKIKKVDKISWRYILIYLISIWIVCFSEHHIAAYIFPSIVGIFSIYGLFKSVIPGLLRNWKKRKGMEKKCMSIALSNYSTSLQESVIFIMLMFVLISGIVPVLISQNKISNEYITGVISYLVITIMIVVCIVYKFIDRMVSRENEFNCSKRIGYVNKDIKIVMLLEVVIYYFTIIFLPLPLMMIIGFKFIANNDITLLRFLLLMAIFIIPIIVSMFITYNLYIKLMVKKEK